MLHKKEKAQGLVEFALILPVLLLLLLGIIEGARVIWSYITVQTAVREAARYAVSGRPYATDTNSTACLTPEGDPNATAPWICDPYSRTVAIENVAMNRITSSLNVSTPCRSGGYALCEGISNAYGVRVIGQYTEELTPTDILTGVGHAGNQGLMVRVEAYYNVQMLDPIFDTIMGGNVIPVRAAIEMQNEGIDSVLGSIPPPSIGNTTGITGSTGTGQGPNGEIIRAQNDRVAQLSNLGVVLQNHFNLAGPYDIHLSDGTNDHILTCTPATPGVDPPSVNTDPTTNNRDFSCFISGDIVPGFYTLFSTLAGFQNPLATYVNQVEIYLDDVPRILVNNGAGGNIVAVNSIADIELYTHQVTNQPYTVTVVYGATEQPLFTGVTLSGSPHRIPWAVPSSLLNPSNPCPTGGGTPCLIRSYSNTGQLYATGEFFLNQPEIVIAGGLRTFAQNETMRITLRGHSPGVRYDLKISDGGSNEAWLGRTDVADSTGQVTNPTNWTVPFDWPDGNYTISSHPASGNIPRPPASMNSGNQVVSLDITIDTPDGAYITIDGGYTWPAGSVINIQANRHPQVDNPYYFNFGSWRVPIPTGNPVNTFNADSNQSFVATYNIPLTATTGVATTFSVESRRNANNNLVAQRNVTVLPVPVLLVLEGSPVSPDSIITVQIYNHAPDSTFNIFYLDQPLGAILTDANGQGQLRYDLKNLPVNVPPGLSTTFGTPYPVTSRSTINNSTIATFQLTLRAADLRVTSIQVPPNPTLNSSARITFTIQNTSPVTITRYFDTDIYFNPSPQVPLYSLAQVNNFPGDAKFWRNQLGPGASFTLTQSFFIGSYGPHVFYSYADTSNLIFNELSEFNNILSNTLTLSCTTATYTTDTFNSGLSTWAQEPYGNGDNGGTAPQIVTVSGNQRLRLRSDGSNTLRSDDNALQSGPTPAGGYTFFHKTTAITSTSGLDVRVAVIAAPNNTNGAKAGLELRDTLSPTSPKIEFGLTRSGNNTYRVQVVYRDSAVPEPLAVYQSANVTIGNPVWLRIQRYGGTNTFLFYFVQSATTPTSWGAPVHTATVNLSNQLRYGLFMNNNTNGSHQNADFDNFTVYNPGSCPPANGQPPENNIPPGQATCTDPLQEKGFETQPTVRWLGVGSNGTFPTTSSYAGNQALLADTNRSGPNNPTFSQRFQMPTGLISATTTVGLELYRNVEQEVDGADSSDQFYAVLATSANAASAVTLPVLVASGDMGAITYNPSNWQRFQANFQPISGVSLADYAGQDLFLHFYNNSNQTSGCPPFNCHNTSFYFDNITLSPCTVQPLPTVINTRIKGEVVLHPSAGSAQRITGVKVWAYAEGGELYETTTIQNGEFNFYNLPATTNGIKYILYSEHHIVSSLDPNQIETLSSLSSVILSNTNNNTNPVVTKLDLY
ncbi:MAG: pilus assembly protein [Anaerolineae bacterium]|nr:pilus assembly protein [Anaerolineae bacterium]